MRHAVGKAVIVMILTIVLIASSSTAAIATDVKFPGAYSTAVDLGDGLFVRGLSVFHADGTLRFTNILFFGGDMGFPFGPWLTNESYGVWKKTGPRSATGAHYAFIADPDTRIVHSVMKVTFYAEWDKNGETGWGQTYLRVEECPGGPLTCPDPADLGPGDVDFGALTFRRLPDG